MSGRFALVKLPRNPSANAYQEVAYVMGRIHNMFISSLNAMYDQAPAVTTTGEKLRYFMFCQQWVAGIEGHHHHEETTFFPQIEQTANKPGLMAANVQQHEQFHSGVNRLKEYTRNSDREYNPGQIREIIDSFGDVFSQHMSDELDTLTGLETYISEAKLRELWHNLERAVHGG